VSWACIHDCKGMLDTALALRPFCAAAATLMVGMIGRALRGDNDGPRNW
jgi:hypothetical protein